MINPSEPGHITNYTRTDAELFEFWLFCLFVRGKNADVQARKLDAFLDIMGGVRSIVNSHSLIFEDDIRSALEQVKAGQYDTLTAAIIDTLNQMSIFGTGWLRVASVEDLEKIRGVGPKTARFFVMNSRENQRYAALDTHILQFLHDREGCAVPKNTPPTGQRYRDLENTFLLIADYEGVKPEVLDLAVWRASRERHSQAWREYLPADT